MNSYNFVTRRMTYEMEYIATELHELLLHNKKFLSFESTDLNQKFSLCIVVICYAGNNLKQKSSQGMHCDYVYTPKDGSFARKASSHVENNPAVIYSIGDCRVLI